MTVNANSKGQHLIQIKKGIMKRVYRKYKKDYGWSPSACICEKS